MGSDFMCTVLAIKKDQQPDWEKARAYVNEEGRDISQELSETAYDRFEGDNEAAKEHLLSAIDELEERLENSRQTGVIEFAGYTLHVTGGMSFGDDPTDIFEPMAMLGACEGAYQAAGFSWPKGLK